MHFAGTALLLVPCSAIMLPGLHLFALLNILFIFAFQPAWSKGDDDRDYGSGRGFHDDDPDDYRWPLLHFPPCMQNCITRCQEMDKLKLRCACKRSKDDFLIDIVECAATRNCPSTTLDQFLGGLDQECNKMDIKIPDDAINDARSSASAIYYPTSAPSPTPTTYEISRSTITFTTTQTLAEPTDTERLGPSLPKRPTSPIISASEPSSTRLSTRTTTTTEETSVRDTTTIEPTSESLPTTSRGVISNTRSLTTSEDTTSTDSGAEAAPTGSGSPSDGSANAVPCVKQNARLWIFWGLAVATTALLNTLS